MESENIPLMFFLGIRDELPKSPYIAAKGRVVLRNGNDQNILGMCEYQNGARFCNVWKYFFFSWRYNRQWGLYFTAV